jgi:hypothetical protein
MAYFKVTVAPDNDLAFERIINVPKRGIGEASVQKMHALARREPGRSPAPPWRWPRPTSCRQGAAQPCAT